jgi:glycosyltransferase involved in cell wall biosynthesis
VFVSIIICSIRRPELFGKLIDCLHAQVYRDAEVLIVGSATQPELDFPATETKLRVRFVPAPKGLAPARNVGLRRASGDVVCFFDDDVLVGPEFLAEAVSIFEEPGNADVGGLTAFDTVNYSTTVSGRWRFRALLGITPSLNPGDVSHLGRSVPLSFFQPFMGVREVKWLPGFCQIFRRSAIRGLQYDEKIIVEDRDFSMEVGRTHRLLISGDLKVQHLRDDEARHPNHVQTWRASFGLGRSFAKRRRAFRDWFTIVHVLLGEIIIDVIVAVGRPSLVNCKVPVWRLNGFVSGFASYRSGS